jgi:hypothetical protein
LAPLPPPPPPPPAHTLTHTYTTHTHIHAHAQVLWNSGWVTASDSLNIAWKGAGLASNQRFRWSVQERDALEVESKPGESQGAVAVAVVGLV